MRTSATFPDQKLDSSSLSPLTMPLRLDAPPYIQAYMRYIQTSTLREPCVDYR